MCNYGVCLQNASAGPEVADSKSPAGPADRFASKNNKTSPKTSRAFGPASLKISVSTGPEGPADPASGPADPASGPAVTGTPGMRISPV